MMSAQWQNSRGLSERIIVEGRLVLETPAHFGQGDTESPLDMPLLRDPLEGKALLTGASLAGALRNYLHLINKDLAVKLFGEVTSSQSVESRIIIDDAIGDLPQVELRDQVAMDPKTGTAADKQKYDIELFEARTAFDLNFELLVTQKDDDLLVQAFAQALHGLETGEEISLGKRKRRGFGRCKVKEWTVRRYEMTSPAGLFAWLENDRSKKFCKTGQESITAALDTTLPEEKSSRWCILETTFAIDGSILIRSQGSHPKDPDAVHLSTKKNGNPVSLISGTSLAGALRKRTIIIGNTLGKDGYALANSLFGVHNYDNEKPDKLTASRVWVEEIEIQKPIELVQTRLKIDRFTGGAYPGALFSEQPVFSGPQTMVTFKVKLFDPKEEEVGLLLLLLKDLWLGDLTLGGEAGVGRGCLKGIEATLQFNGSEWKITQGEGRQITVTTDAKKTDLQTFVERLEEVSYG